MNNLENLQRHLYGKSTDVVLKLLGNATIGAKRVLPDIVDRATQHAKERAYDNINKLLYPESSTGKILKSTIQVLDPTGISSYPDVFQAGKEMYENPSWANAGNLAAETFGALPLVGKIAKPIRLLKQGSNTIKIKKQANSINKAVDTLPELIPGVRKFAEKTQNFTSKYFTNPLYNTIRNGRKGGYEAPEIADILVDSVNGLNAISDLKELGKNIYEAKTQNK